MSLLAYWLAGTLGLPAFAAGASGPAYAMGPTGGYLLGFVAAAFITGWLAECGWDRHVATTALAMLAGRSLDDAAADIAATSDFFTLTPSTQRGQDFCSP